MLHHFNAVVKTQGHQPAATLRDTVLTYQELDAHSNQVAHWLTGRGLVPGSVAALYLEHPLEWMVCLLGILKAGATFLPLSPTDPVEQLLQQLRDNKACVLISEVKFLRSLNALQWSCPAVHSILCIDSIDFYKESEPAHGTMRKELWEYMGQVTQDDIAGGGWMNSYTRALFSRAEMDEYTSNTLTKLQPYLGPDKRVLEVGCATGLTMYAIAPFVKAYYGTDLSQAAIDYNRRICAEKELDHIQLACIDAASILSIDERAFDIIIINSVVQYLPGFNALRHFVGDAIELLNNDGILYAGDVMDLDQKETLIEDLRRYKQAHPQAATKLDFPEELFVPRAFFADLLVEFPVIRSVQCSAKLFTISNELTQYRYDALLQLDKSRTGVLPTQSKSKNQFDARDIRQCPTGPVAPSVRALEMATRDVVLPTSELPSIQFCLQTFSSLLHGTTLHFVTPDPLPTTEPLASSPRFYLGGKADEASTPINQVAAQLAVIWEDIVAMPAIGLTDNFFDIGGSSLKAIQLINQINHDFGTQFTILDLFMYPNIQAFAAMMQESSPRERLPDDAVQGATGQMDAVLRILNRPTHG